MWWIAQPWQPPCVLYDTSRFHLATADVMASEYLFGVPLGHRYISRVTDSKDNIRMLGCEGLRPRSLLLEEKILRAVDPADHLIIRRINEGMTLVKGSKQTLCQADRTKGTKGRSSCMLYEERGILECSSGFSPCTTLVALLKLARLHAGRSAATFDMLHIQPCFVRHTIDRLAKSPRQQIFTPDSRSTTVLNLPGSKFAALQHAYRMPATGDRVDVLGCERSVLDISCNIPFIDVRMM